MESPVTCRTFNVVDAFNSPPLPSHCPRPRPRSHAHVNLSEKRSAPPRGQHTYERASRGPLPRVDRRVVRGSTGDSDLGTSELELELEIESERPPPDVAHRLRLIREVLLQKIFKIKYLNKYFYVQLKFKKIFKIIIHRKGSAPPAKIARKQSFTI